jgi:hypothetical protein
VTLIQFLLMTIPVLAVCWMVIGGAGKFGRFARLATLVALATMCLWLVVPWEQSFRNELYTIYLISVLLFEAGIVATGTLSLFAEPPWPGWVKRLVRMLGIILALLWGFSLLFGVGVLFSL